jgi:hypothetical protein
MAARARRHSRAVRTASAVHVRINAEVGVAVQEQHLPQKAVAAQEVQPWAR